MLCFHTWPFQLDRRPFGCSPGSYRSRTAMSILGRNSAHTPRSLCEQGGGCHQMVRAVSTVGRDSTLMHRLLGSPPPERCHSASQLAKFGAKFGYYLSVKVVGKSGCCRSSANHQLLPIVSFMIKLRIKTKLTSARLGAAPSGRRNCFSTLRGYHVPQKTVEGRPSRLVFVHDLRKKSWHLWHLT